MAIPRLASASSASPASRLAATGAILADPTRSKILCTLMDGRAYTGTELANWVGVARSTTSEHLSRLLDAGMVTVEAQGRHRYFRLANQEIAELLEIIGSTAPDPAPPRPQALSPLAHARTCYNHLAGFLGVSLYDALWERDLISDEGHGLDYTPNGRQLLSNAGIDIISLPPSSRAKPALRPCLDWTERRHHLAGPGATELLRGCLANQWLVQGNRPRSIRVTNQGRSALDKHFGLNLDSL